MKILPVIYSQNPFSQSHNLSENGYVNKSTPRAFSPSFGLSEAEVAKKIATNSQIRNVHADFIGKVANAAFVNIIRIAAGEKNIDGLAADGQKDENNFNSQVLSLLGIKNINSDELESLKQECLKLQQENEKLKNQVTLLEQKIIELEKSKEEVKTENDNLNEIPLVEEVQENESNDIPKSADEEALSVFEFPKRPGRLSSVLSELKSCLNGLLVTEEQNEKLTKICLVLFKEKSVIVPEIECYKPGEFENSLQEAFLNQEKVGEVIDTYYKYLRKNHYITDNEAVEPEIETEGKSNIGIQNAEENNENHVLRRAKTSYTELKEHPIGSSVKVLGKIDLPEEKKQRPWSKKSDDVDKLQGRNTAKAKNSEDLAPMKSFREHFSTPEDPRERYRYLTVGSIRPDLFEEAQLKILDNSFDPEQPPKVRICTDKAGELIKLILDFNKRLNNNKLNIKIWANNVYKQNNPDLNIKGQLYVKAQLAIAERIAQNITPMELLCALEKYNEYTHIMDAIDNELKTESKPITNRKDSRILAEISDSINSEERFRNWDLHATLRFFDRMIKFDNNTPIKEQCNNALNRLYNLLKEALISNKLIVDTYMKPPIKDNHKDNKLIVKCNPNIIISPELYTDEDREIFGPYEIKIGLCNYNMKTSDKLAPIIKTIFVRNPAEY